MTATAFSRLYSAVENFDALQIAYDDVVRDLFKTPLWESGIVEFRRIPWVRARQARIEDRSVFG